MSYELKIIRKPDYLHAIVTGKNSVENVVQYLDEIQAECAACNCYKVLIEEQLDGPRLDMWEIFNIVMEKSNQVVGMFQSIAYVDVIGGGMMDFAETVATNRGIPIRVFKSVQDAEQWISSRNEMPVKSNSTPTTD